jgi:hypothetical protein
MSRKAVVERVNEVLAPLGFRRRNVTWNRKVGRFVDAIDLQVSKSGDAFTLNAGVAEPELYEACWERPLREFVQVPDSMVVVRPGDLWHDGDAWWGLDDPSASDEVAAKVAKHVVPFLDRMHSFDALEKWLRDENVVRKRYPPPIIYLALLSAARGDRRRLSAARPPNRGDSERVMAGSRGCDPQPARLRVTSVRRLARHLRERPYAWRDRGS